MSVVVVKMESNGWSKPTELSTRYLIHGLLLKYVGRDVFIDNDAGKLGKALSAIIQNESYD